jgi:hypothetical protein
MSELKLTGKVIAIMEKQQVTDTFAKREFVIETDEQYPQMVKFELAQAACDLIDKHKIGDDIKVFFNVRGRRWTNKENKDVYFVSVNAWRLEAVKGAGDEPPEQYTTPPTGEVDSLPF